MRQQVYLWVFIWVAARWLLTVVHLAYVASGVETGHRRRLIRAHAFVRASSTDRLRMLGTTAPDDIDAHHEALVIGSRELRSQALLLGSLALAAWAILATDSVGGIAASSLPLDFLLIGVILTIVGPLLFGTLGNLYTYFGLRLAVGLGYGALVLGLASLVPLVMTGWRSVALEAAVLSALIVAEFFAYTSSLELNRNLTAKRVSGPPDHPDCGSVG